MLRRPMKLLLIAIGLWPATLLGAPAAETTPAQAAGGGASGDEYVRRSELSFQWHGDARVRLDMRNASHSAATASVARLQLRTRLRIGAQGQFVPERAWWGFRLATGTGNPVGRNLVVGGGDANGAGGAVGIDQVYLGFRPHRAVDVSVGKIAAHSLYWVGEGLFDDDLTIPGANLVWRLHDGASGDLVRKVKNTLGFYPLRDLPTQADDPFLLADQLTGRTGDVELGLACFYYSGLQGIAPGTLGAQWTYQQNAVPVLVDDALTVLDGRIRYPFGVGGFPLAIGGELWANLATNRRQVGYEVKLELPELGRGRGHLLYRDSGQNSTFSPWSDSELGAGTGYHSALEAVYTVPVVRSVEFGVNYMHWDRSQPLGSAAAGPQQADRLYLDLRARF